METSKNHEFEAISGQIFFKWEKIIIKKAITRGEFISTISKAFILANIKALESIIDILEFYQTSWQEELGVL
jgi:hypothetical protein